MPEITPDYIAELMRHLTEDEAIKKEADANAHEADDD